MLGFTTPSHISTYLPLHPTMKINADVLSPLTGKFTTNVMVLLALTRSFLLLRPRDCLECRFIRWVITTAVGTEW